MERIRDPVEIEAFLRRDARAHVYALADLDEFFRPVTTWYGARQGGELCALALVLRGLSLTILYAVCPSAHEATRQLLAELEPELPGRLFVNLGTGLESAFGERWRWVGHAECWKLALGDPDALARADPGGVEPFGPERRAELERFYREDAYRPEERGGRFLEPYMLERWPHCGIFEDGRLVCAAGTHVLSDEQGVAALGNIATRPDRRGRGLARAATAFIAQKLAARVCHLGMNVATDNEPALRCYTSLGFRPVLRYVEALLERRDVPA